MKPLNSCNLQKELLNSFVKINIQTLHSCYSQVIWVGFLMLILFSSSCSTTGHFTSNPRDRMAHAGTEFIIKSDSFKINSWTDNYSLYVDSLGNRIWKDNKYRGIGTYTRIKDSLQLTFKNYDSVSVHIVFSEDAMTRKYVISFSNELNNVANYPFSIKDKTGEVLEHVLIPFKDSYTISIEKNKNPSLLHISGVGVRIGEPKINLNDLSEGVNVIKLKSYNGYFAHNEKVTIWAKPVWTGLRYKFSWHRKNRYLPRKWKWKFLNSLYGDY